MNFTRKLFGYGLAGLLVMSTWGAFEAQYGILGGVISATLIIFPTWAINHYNNVVGNSDDAGFVDQGLAIAFAGIFRDLFMSTDTSIFGAALPTIPTFIVIILGAAAGGFVAAQIEKNMGI